MTAPRFKSEKIPGLVMWPNGRIVRVRVEDDGEVARARDGMPEKVILSYGRVDLPGLVMPEAYRDPKTIMPLDEKAFLLVEEYEERKRRELEHRVCEVLSLVIVRAAKKRARGGYRDPA